MRDLCLPGLDARAAAVVMHSVKNVSRNGRTVMVTIHQPSIDIFEAFDALVLLQRGGKVNSTGDSKISCRGSRNCQGSRKEVTNVDISCLLEGHN